MKKAPELLTGAAQLEWQRGINARGEPQPAFSGIAAQTRQRVVDERMQIERLRSHREGTGGDRQQIVGVLKLTPQRRYRRAVASGVVGRCCDGQRLPQRAAYCR